MTERLYTTEATSRDDAVIVDNRQDLIYRVSAPDDLGGAGDGLNPERLYTAALASCLHQAVLLAAANHHVDTSDSSVSARTHLSHDGAQRFRLAAEVAIDLPAVGDNDAYDTVVRHAIETCPMTQHIEIKTLDDRKAQR